MLEFVLPPFPSVTQDIRVKEGRQRQPLLLYVSDKFSCSSDLDQTGQLVKMTLNSRSSCFYLRSNGIAPMSHCAPLTQLNTAGWVLVHARPALCQPSSIRVTQQLHVRARERCDPVCLRAVRGTVAVASGWSPHFLRTTINY